MAVVKANWTNGAYKSPNTKVNIAETIPPLNIVTPPANGKYVFLYDYETTIYTPEAQGIISSSPVGSTNSLPIGSSYNLRFSKGDIVNVVKSNLSKEVTASTPNLNKFSFLIKVPPYVTPTQEYTITDKGDILSVATKDGKKFNPFMSIDNNLGWLAKIADSTPFTPKLGKNFGKNLNPALPKSAKVTPTPTTQTPTTPVVVNGVEQESVDGGFFSDTNNLIMVAVVLVVGYLLLDNKTE
jgi:hypothetical protein